MLHETIRLGLLTGTIKKADLERVTVDTTVQEKAVCFPTDSHLYHKARESLVKEAEKLGIGLRQSYVRLSKQALYMGNRYMAAKQHRRGRKEIKKVKNYLGRVVRDIERSVQGNSEWSALMRAGLDQARDLLNRQKHDKNKLYSWHAPEVECIGKGKAHKKYEFGCKVSYSVTNKSNFIIGAKAFHGNPHDSRTLKDALTQIVRLTGVMPKETYVDLGYRGHDVTESEVILARQKRGITQSKRKRQKRRNAIEPIIGHCKHDRSTGYRNFLKGIMGDKMNAIAMAVGFNLRKILKVILWLIFTVQCWREIKPQGRSYC
ncbi:MAG: IS5 family transposase [Alphaproteobacteria bacterium]|nr:IS5 family transposase [Alphaproteobacteria bacterium]